MEPFDVKGFFTDLGEALKGVVEDAAAKDKENAEKGDTGKGGDVTKAELESLTTQLADVERRLTGEEALSFKTIVTKLNEDITAIREATGLVADNIRKMVDATAVKKSVEGDDAGGGEGEAKKEDTPEKVEKAAVDALNAGMTSILNKPGTKLDLG